MKDHQRYDFSSKGERQAELLLGFFDCELNQDELDEFSEELAHGGAFQSLFAAACLQRQFLPGLLAEKQAEDDVEIPAPSQPLNLLATAYRGTVGFFSREVPFSLLAATVICGLGLLVCSVTYVTRYTQLAQTGSKSEKRQRSESPSEKIAFVGRITGMVDCEWSDDKDFLPPTGYYVSLGRKYKLDSGLMEITYDTGAKVILQGPCTYEVESAAGGYLSLGSLTGKVEVEKARGFCVRTPTGMVTDLGTEFAVEVSREGTAQVVVFTGEVVSSVTSLDDKQIDPVHLKAGQSASIGRTKIVQLDEASAKLALSRFKRTMPQPDSTLAYWRFEEGPVDSRVPAQGQNGTHLDGYVKDRSGNNNHLRAGTEGTAPMYRADVPAMLIPQTGEPNLLSLQFGPALDPNVITHCLFSCDDYESARSLNRRPLTQWTVEASVKFDRFRTNSTFLCWEHSQDEMPEASLYLQAATEPPMPPDESVFSIRVRTASGTFVILTGTTPLATGRWYRVAAVGDGRALSLYLFNDATGAYRLEGTLPLFGPLDTGDGCWLVGQGMWGNRRSDQTSGLIDEVRISAAALKPEQFLFSPNRTKEEFNTVPAAEFTKKGGK